MILIPSPTLPLATTPSNSITGKNLTVQLLIEPGIVLTMFVFPSKLIYVEKNSEYVDKIIADLREDRSDILHVRYTCELFMLSLKVVNSRLT